MRSFRPLFSTLFLTLSILSLSGCGVSSWFSSSKPEGSTPAPADAEKSTPETSAAVSPTSTADNTADRAADKAPDATVASTMGEEFVEIVWKVSDRKITAYHIHYGTSENDLPHHIRIPVSEIETFDHPISGKAHRVRIKVPEVGAAVYVSVQAENEFGTSAKSASMRVEAVK